MARILDELAEIFDTLRGGLTRDQLGIALQSLHLRDQFQWPLTPELWDEFALQLGCPLPPLTPLPEVWLWEHDAWQLPDGLETIGDLLNHLRDIGADTDDWPWDVSLYDWREARIFVRVRGITSEQLQIPKSEIHRHSRFVEDLKVD